MLTRAGTSVLAAIIAASCAGAPAAQPGPTQTSSATPSPSSTTVAAPTASPTPTSAPAAAGGIAVVDLVLRSAAPAYKVTYALSATSTLGIQVQQTQTQVWRSPELRIDTTSTAGDISQTVSVFLLRRGEYVCFKLFGAGQCLFSPAGQIAGYEQQMKTPADDFRAQYARLETAPLPGRTIAGQAGQCFSFRPKQGETGIAGRACYTADGIPLLWVTNIGLGETTLEATSVLRQVVDADLQPPYPAVSAPPLPVPVPTTPPTPTPTYQTG